MYLGTFDTPEEFAKHVVGILNSFGAAEPTGRRVDWTKKWKDLQAEGYYREGNEYYIK